MGKKLRSGIFGQGVHSIRISIRIFGLAAVDLGLTFAAATTPALLKGWPIWLTFLVLFLIGMLFHLAFGVHTAFLEAL